MHIESNLIVAQADIAERPQNDGSAPIKVLPVDLDVTDDVEIVRAGSRIEIHLNRPDKKNALTSAIYTAMANALEAADADETVLSVIIAARGSAFCSGNDLRDFLANPPSGNNSPVHRFLAAIATAKIVLVAAIQGPAVGIGATMLLHCDHVVAADDAFLQFSFVNMALVPEAASSLLLPQAVGRLRAAEMMLTGRPVAATEALGCGLVSAVVPVGEQLAAAQQFTEKLDSHPPVALRLTKQLLRTDAETVSDRMAREGALFSQRLASPEFAEAARAFAEKRPPKF